MNGRCAWSEWNKVQKPDLPVFTYYHLGRKTIKPAHTSFPVTGKMHTAIRRRGDSLHLTRTRQNMT